MTEKIIADSIGEKRHLQEPRLSEELLVQAIAEEVLAKAPRSNDWLQRRALSAAAESARYAARPTAGLAVSIACPLGGTTN